MARRRCLPRHKFSIRMHLRGLEPHGTREKWLWLCTRDNPFTNGATICHWRRHKVSQCHITRNLVSLVPVLHNLTEWATPVAGSLTAHCAPQDFFLNWILFVVVRPKT
jgi:hypothetical protein